MTHNEGAQTCTLTQYKSYESHFHLHHAGFAALFQSDRQGVVFFLTLDLHFTTFEKPEKKDKHKQKALAATNLLVNL